MAFAVARPATKADNKLNCMMDVASVTGCRSNRGISCITLLKKERKSI